MSAVLCLLADRCQCGEVLSLHVWGRSVKEPGTLERYVHEGVETTHTHMRTCTHAYML